ncbi:TPA: EAL domain-containing protein [Vibrio parahaemolyticus]
MKENSFYSLEINDRRFVVSFSLSASSHTYFIYIHEEGFDSMTNKVQLNDKEAMILKTILSGEAKKPISTVKIENECHRQYGYRFDFYTVKNSVASLRKKMNSLLLFYFEHLSYQSDRFIVNINRKGFYWALDEYTQPRPCNIRKKRFTLIQIIKSYLYALFKSYQLQMNARIVFSNFLKSTSMTILGAISFIFILQIVPIILMFADSSQSASRIMSETASMSCSQKESLIAKIQTIHNIDSLIIDNCLVSYDAVSPIDNNQIKLWKNKSDSYFFTNATINGRFIEARFNKKKVSTRYEYFLIPGIIDTIKIFKNNIELNTIKNVTHREGSYNYEVFRFNLSNHTSIAFYMQRLFLKSIILLSILVLLPLFSKGRFILKMLLNYRDFSLNLEVVANTISNDISYYEVLSCFKNTSTNSAISMFRSADLLCCHTIFIMKLLSTSNINKQHSVGFNVCPSIFNRYINIIEIKKFFNSLPFKLIVLEITEDSNVAYNDTITSNINKINAMDKVAIAIDDFGIGNNNVDLIKKLTPKYVKIDKIFLSDISTLKEIVSLVSTSSYVIIEGVETKILSQSLTCSFPLALQQGWFFDARDSKEID